MEHAFRAMALANGGLSALISQRFYPVPAPQADTRPYITYQVISGPRDYTQDGPDGVTTFRIQCRLYADDYTSGRALRDAFISAVGGLRQQDYGSPAIRIQACFIDNERDAYQPELDEAGPRLWGKFLDVLVTANV